MAQGRRAITRDLYEKLVEAFRASPGDHNGVARLVQVSFRTARKSWYTGWKSYEWARPIKDVIENDRVSARAELLEEAPDTAPAVVNEKLLVKATNLVKSAKHDATESRVEEAKLVRATRQVGMMALGAMGKLLPGIIKLSEATSLQLEKLAKSDHLNERAALNLLNSFARSYNQITLSAKTAMEMERLYLGEPTSILGIQMDEVEDMTLEECLAESKAMERAIEEAKEHGHLKLMQGGKK